MIIPGTPGVVAFLALLVVGLGLLLAARAGLLPVIWNCDRGSTNGESDDGEVDSR